MKEYTKKQRKNFSLWRIKLFGNFWGLFFCFFFALQLHSDFSHFETYNCIFFHVPLAWYTILLYIYIVYIYIYSSMVYIYIIRYNIIYIIYVLFSGFLWSYSVFGGFFFFDIKILSYFLLLLALLIFLYFVKNSKILASLVLVTGFYFYLQSKISPLWANTIHQKTLPDFDLNYLTFQIFVPNKIILIILLGILVLQTFFFWKKIKINETELEKNA